MLSSILKFPSPTQKLSDRLLEKKNISLWIKRDDLIHPNVSGNKWRKLKYNIAAARKENKETLLTFGGAYSNHIAATAAAGKIAGMKTIGVIRGDEFVNLNATLAFAQEEGMELHFVSRMVYKNKNEAIFLADLVDKYGNFFTIAEGGANRFGVKGCREIIAEEKEDYNYVCCAAGTGTTAAGILSSLQNEEELLVFPALKGGEGLRTDILSWQKNKENSSQLKMVSEYHFGGYAKVKTELVEFVNSFYRQHQLPLDLIYTGKMMYGLYDLIRKDYFPAGSKILFYHSGGLQGNDGFKQRKNIELVY